ncbi:MAG TPA: cytochrome c peroxidase [Pyrinomonadaceae bacterium]|jgi:cytochrome c peroxidase|nr:cytochrome c peroxidase [Pyrinomonadaceae bacterium]
MKRYVPVLLIVATIVFAIAFWPRNQSSSPLAESRIAAREYSPANEPIEPLPPSPTFNEKTVALGQKLFEDRQLSRNNSISCSSCHSLSLGGADGRIRSIGIDNRVGTINAPTVFNSGFNFKQFWDGRAETLEAQIDGPAHEASEMDSNWLEITNKLKQQPEYQAAFAELYPEGIQSNTVKDAIATFERSLSTPNSRFDQFLQGVNNVLSAEEQDGYRLFKNYGCSSCHQGLNVGGNMFQKFGVMGDYFADRGNITKTDLGRFNVTGVERDRHVFKVPSLRNAALTAPYFHDGSAATLEDAVAVMAKYQLGRRMSPEEIRQIVSFIKTLTGEYKGKAF